MCSDSEAYGLKKHGLTRSDCRCSVVGVYRAYISRNLSSCPPCSTPCSTCQSKEPSIDAKLMGQLNKATYIIPVGMGSAYVYWQASVWPPRRWQPALTNCAIQAHSIVLNVKA